MSTICNTDPCCLTTSCSKTIFKCFDYFLKLPLIKDVRRIFKDHACYDTHEQKQHPLTYECAESYRSIEISQIIWVVPKSCLSCHNEKHEILPNQKR